MNGRILVRVERKVDLPSGSNRMKDVAPLDVRRGQTLSVFGGSGAGLKNLFASLIDAALRRPNDSSDYLIALGFEGDRPGALGVLFDDVSWSFCNLRVDEEIAFVLENRGVEPTLMSTIVDSALAQVGLLGFGPRRISTLSGGELRKVALAAILAGRPDLIISDDLNGHLDLAALDQLELVLQSYVNKNGACWLDFRRRWETFLPPADACALLDGGELSIDPREIMRSGQPAIGQPFGIALSTHLSAQLQCEVPLFASASEAVRWLAEGDVRLATVTSPVCAGASVLKADGIWFTYDKTKPLLRGCSIELDEGVIYALGGRNGSGKSTLARILCGLLRSDTGQISLGDRPAYRSMLRRAGSLVFQKPEYQFITDSVEEEMVLAQADNDEREGYVDAPAMLATFGLVHLSKNHPFSLSIGEKRRLSVACAIAGGRNFVIVDEPTLGQDEEQTQLLGSQLRSAAAAGRSVLVITHDPEFIVGYCDQVMWLEDGQLSTLGIPSEAFADVSGTMFAGRSHLLGLWEAASKARIADGHPPRRLEEVTVSCG